MRTQGVVVGQDIYDVFVSYSRADWRHAADIDAALRARGLKPFFDRRNLPPGLPWVRALEEAIRACKAAIVLVGPRGFGNTQQYERDLALVRQSRDAAFPVVPVVLPEATLDRPFNFLQILTWVDFSHVVKVSDAPDELEHLLTAVQGGQISADAAREPICPYRGLDAFREEDSAFFFGRGSADDPNTSIGQLVRKAREHSFVMVVGRSGSGKSSLIFAGLVPALRRERDQFWNVLSLRPGRDPLRALAVAFNPRADDEGAAAFAAKIGSEADKLRTGDPELLSHMIRQELEHAEGQPDRLLLYVDQWEELYVQAPSASDEERASRQTDVNRFIDLLLNAARSAPATIVGTVRADFYDPLISHDKVRALLPTHQVLLGSMSRSELERSIVEPAKKAVLSFDPPSLVGRILDEAGEDDSMLPLLQYALKETWAFREGSVMTADSYARSGGVREAIRITADRTFDALSTDDQQGARQLFLRLVTPGEGQEDTRARAGMPAEPRLRRIVEQFASPRTRLLVTGWDRAARPTVEVAHEALIRTWPRLRGWIDVNRDKLRSRAAVVQARDEWEQHGRREDLLLPAGFQLERARAFRAEPGDLLTDDIEEFIALSSARAEAEHKRREADLVRDEARVAEIKTLQWDKERQLAEKDRQLTLQGVKLAQQEVAISETAKRLEHQQANVLAELSAVNLLRGRFDSALRLAAYGARIDVKLPSRTVKASPATAALATALGRATWRLSLGGHNEPVTCAGFSPDGSRIVTASMDRTARVWDAASGKKITVLHGHEDIVSSAAFSPDGSRIVTASWDRTARIWNSSSGAEIAVLRGHARFLASAAFSPGGPYIVTASWDRTARIWDAASGSEIVVLCGHDGAVSSAAFSPDRSRIVTASEDRTVRIWDAARGTEIAVLRGHEGCVFCAAFSADGSRIVTASADSTACIRDAASGKDIAVLRGHDERVSSAAFSPDDSRIVTASWDRTARVWDSASGTQIAALRGHEEIVLSAGFSADGSRIVTASADGTARVWHVGHGKEIAILRGYEDDASASFSPRTVRVSEHRTARIRGAASGGEIAVLRGHDGRVKSAAVSPDESRTVAVSGDRAARKWSAGNEEEIAILRGHDEPVGYAAFSPDGSQIVTASSCKIARLWNTASGKEIAVLRGHDAPVGYAAFSPDGMRIVTASGDKTARIWDAMTAKEIAIICGHDHGVRSAAFSRDGMRIITASDDNTARIWDAATTRELVVLRGHGASVRSAAFSPDDLRTVTASWDGTARLWNTASGKEIAVLRGHDAPVGYAAFSPDGMRIVTASGDKTARIWDAMKARELAVLCGHESSVCSAAFSPDGLRIVTASRDKTARIWDAGTAKEIAILCGHDHGVRSAAFTADGSRIVTASEDETARIWDARLYQLTAKGLLEEACRRLAGLTKLTRDEMHLASYPDSIPEIDVCRD